jgi:SAM-dependent methyltransferase
MEFVAEVLPPAAVRGLRVLEVGSYDVNGGVREMLEPVARYYVGVDIRPGPGVDVVCDAAAVHTLGLFDVVVSTEMMEHAADWRGALRGMVRALTSGGVLVLTMRGPGSGRHDHPADHWRFTPELLTEALARLGMAGIPRRDPGLGYDDGVFYVGVRRAYADADLSDLAAEPAPVS